jgi:hypothetical protein
MPQVMHMRSQQYGPLYKETIGNMTSVVITNLDEYAKVVHADGRFPIRPPFMPILHYEKKKKIVLLAANRLASE